MNIETNSLGQPIGRTVIGWSPPAFPPRETIVGRYCRLEPLDVSSHCESLFAANQQDSQGLNWTYLPYGQFKNIEDYRRWMEETCLGDDPLFFAICDLRTGEAVGVASYLRISPDAGSIEVGT